MKKKAPPVCACTNQITPRLTFNTASRSFGENVSPLVSFIGLFHSPNYTTIRRSNCRETARIRYHHGRYLFPWYPFEAAEILLPGKREKLRVLHSYVRGMWNCEFAPREKPIRLDLSAQTSPVRARATSFIQVLNKSSNDSRDAGLAEVFRP